MTARYALMRSDNNATIGLASMVGFDRVAALARDAGIKSARGTPSVAIGSYDATPLDMAGAYTVFANGGVHLDPWMLASVRTPTGDIITDYTPDSQQVLDPRVAYLTTNMMEDCAAQRSDVRDWAGYCGTGGCATWDSSRRRRARPAPTTTHGSPASPATCCASCGWATTTTPTSSSKARDAAAPIWAEFMKKAVQLPQYSDTNEFTAAGRRGDGEARQGDQPAERRGLPRRVRLRRFSTAPRRRIPATTRRISAISSRRYLGWAKSGN